MFRALSASLALALTAGGFALALAGPATAAPIKNTPIPTGCKASFDGTSVTYPEGSVVQGRSRLTGRTATYLCHNGQWVQVIDRAAPDAGIPTIDAPEPGDLTGV